MLPEVSGCSKQDYLYSATSISINGKHIVGSCKSCPEKGAMPITWINGVEYSLLSHIPLAADVILTDCSSDGKIVIGCESYPRSYHYITQPICWENGVSSLLPALHGSTISKALVCSVTGESIAGNCEILDERVKCSWKKKANSNNSYSVIDTDDYLLDKLPPFSCLMDMIWHNGLILKRMSHAVGIFIPRLYMPDFLTNFREYYDKSMSKANLAMATGGLFPQRIAAERGMALCGGDRWSSCILKNGDLQNIEIFLLDNMPRKTVESLPENIKWILLSEDGGTLVGNLTNSTPIVLKIPYFILLPDKNRSKKGYAIKGISWDGTISVGTKLASEEDCLEHNNAIIWKTCYSTGWSPDLDGNSEYTCLNRIGSVVGGVHEIGEYHDFHPFVCTASSFEYLPLTDNFHSGGISSLDNTGDICVGSCYNLSEHALTVEQACAWHKIKDEYTLKLLPVPSSSNVSRANYVSGDGAFIAGSCRIHLADWSSALDSPGKELVSEENVSILINRQYADTSSSESLYSPFDTIGKACVWYNGCCYILPSSSNSVYSEAHYVFANNFGSETDVVIIGETSYNAKVWVYKIRNGDRVISSDSLVLEMVLPFSVRSMTSVSKDGNWIAVSVEDAAYLWHRKYGFVDVKELLLSMDANSIVSAIQDVEIVSVDAVSEDVEVLAGTCRKVGYSGELEYLPFKAKIFSLLKNATFLQKISTHTARKK